MKPNFVPPLSSLICKIYKCYKKSSECYGAAMPNKNPIQLWVWIRICECDIWKIVAKKYQKIFSLFMHSFLAVDAKL